MVDCNLQIIQLRKRRSVFFSSEAKTPMWTKSICRLTKQKSREALLFRSLSKSIAFRLFVYIVVSLFSFTILFHFKIKRHFGLVHENFQEKYNNVHPD